MGKYDLEDRYYLHTTRPSKEEYAQVTVLEDLIGKRQQEITDRLLSFLDPQKAFNALKNAANEIKEAITEEGGIENNEVDPNHPKLALLNPLLGIYRIKNLEYRLHKKQQILPHSARSRSSSSSSSNETTNSKMTGDEDVMEYIF